MKEAEMKTAAGPMWTRRALLQTAGGVIAAASVPAAASAGAGARTDAASSAAATPMVIDTLAAYMAGAATRALPADTVEHTKHHILDTLAAMVSGSTLPPGRVALAFARARAG